MNYKVREDFAIEPGFSVAAADVLESISLTNAVLRDLPQNLYRSLDFKTTSAILGAVFCDSLASRTDGIVNPIEKGHPDIVPQSATSATEEQLRNYPIGIEVKCTIGNVASGSNLKAGDKRIDHLTGVTWQAHHREVQELMGLAWDFVQGDTAFRYPGITGVFYSANLKTEDWGAISGTTGRNTKVTGMRSSGKSKMGTGWVAQVDCEKYLKAFSRLLGVPINSI